MKRSRRPFSSLLVLAAALLAAPAALAAAEGLSLRVLQHQALRDLKSDGSGRPTSFEAYGRRFELALERNERLRFVTPARLPGVEVLRGELRGLARSWVRVTRTPAGLYGMFSDGYDVYVIEPARELATHAVGSLEARGREPVVYRLADTVMPIGGASCGATVGTSAMQASTTGLQQFEAIAAELQMAFSVAAVETTMQIDVAVVGDHEFSQLSLGGLTPEQAIAARMNVVDGIFSSQVGVKLVVSSATVFRDPADPFTSTSAAGTLLDEVADWRQATPAQRAAGLSHLMTGRDLEGSTAGIAYLNALCNSRFGVSLSQAVNLSASTAALVIAHELGHNFGASHDGETGSVCETTPQTFLMAPRITNSNQFSQCSLDTIAPRVNAAACVVPLSVADADLDLPAPARRLRGTPFDYQFAVRSIGQQQVDGLTVSIALPASLAFNSASVQGGSACAAAGSTVTCSVGSLAPQATRSVTLNLTGQQAGGATATFTLDSANDGVAGNDTGSASFTIDAAADLEVSLAASPSSFTAGGTSQVTATVRHLGGDAASDARLAFTIPAGLSVTAVSANALGCTLAAGAVNCAATAVAAPATERVTLTVTGDQAGSRQVAATVGATLADPVPGNNSAQVQVEVRAAASGGSSGGGSGGGGGSLGLSLVGLLGLLAYCRRPLTAAAPRRV